MQNRPANSPDILRERWAGYGEQIVHALSGKMAAEFGKGFSEKSLRRMILFKQEPPAAQFVATLSRQLGSISGIIASDDRTRGVPALSSERSAARRATTLVQSPSSNRWITTLASSKSNFGFIIGGGLLLDVLHCLPAAYAQILRKAPDGNLAATQRFDRKSMKSGRPGERR